MDAETDLPTELKPIVGDCYFELNRTALALMQKRDRKTVQAFFRLALPSFIRHGARWEIRHTFYPPKSLKTNTQGRDGFRDEWATPTARAIAAGIVESGDWSRLVILADAIQDAGCEDAALLGLMRLAGVLGLDMGGWWLMERLCPPERLPQFAKLMGLRRPPRGRSPSTE